MPESTSALPVRKLLSNKSALHTAVSISVVLLCGLLVRWPNWHKSLSVDEAWALATASASDFWTAARQDVHPPVYYLLLRGLQTFSQDPQLLRLSSFFCSLALPILAVWVMRRHKFAALITGLILALLPGYVEYAHQLRPYAWLLLLHGCALWVSILIHQGDSRWQLRAGLALVLALAVGTHLITIFYMLALAPLLLWCDLRNGPKAWLAAMLPTLPAGLLALLLKFCFITPPETIGGGWWLESSLAKIHESVALALGWQEIQWFSDAWSRHAPGGGVPVFVLASVCAFAACMVAWSSRGRPDPLHWLLLLGACIYVLSTGIYSVFFENIIMPRTLFPAVLLFCVGVGYGIERSSWHQGRLLAAAAIALYLLMTSLAIVRQAGAPEDGLKQFAATINACTRPDDLVVRLRAMDYSLAVYGCPPKGIATFDFDQSKVIAPQLAALLPHLQKMPPASRVLVAYRNDHYFYRLQPAVSKLLSMISGMRSERREIYRNREFVLLIFQPSPAEPPRS